MRLTKCNLSKAWTERNKNTILSTIIYFQEIPSGYSLSSEKGKKMQRSFKFLKSMETWRETFKSRERHTLPHTCCFWLHMLYQLNEGNFVAVSWWRRGAAVWGGNNIWTAAQIIGGLVIVEGKWPRPTPKNTVSSIWMEACHTGPHITASQLVKHSQCLQDPAPARISTCQDVYKCVSLHTVTCCT